MTYNLAAASARRLEVLEVLVAAGVQIRDDRIGQSALALARRTQGNEAIVQYLEERMVAHGEPGRE